MLSHNGGRRVPRGLIPALAGAAMFGAVPVLLAQPAQAATAGCYGDCQPGVVRSAAILKYDSLLGHNDQITVSVAGGVWTVTNHTSTLTAGAGCTLVTTHQANCEAAPKVFSISVRGLDGDDSITNATAIPSLLRAGAWHPRRRCRYRSVHVRHSARADAGRLVRRL